MPVIEKIYKILSDTWGYATFRPPQKEIIISVLTGNDTLALLPTGGGKSLCYQLPAVYSEGFVLVITPLIALMKDQVENLKKKKIPAAAIYSGMTYTEIDRTLDNAIYGSYKLLYVSPERLETDIFLARLPNMNISLVAVDESHCISEWGYDFRPSYLKIAKIREYLPKTPFLALSASATKRVMEDIIEKLEIKNEQVFTKSFDRPNLIYAVVDCEDKPNKLVEILGKVKGSAIVYGGTRKVTKETAYYLRQNKIDATYYHAGLDNAEREKRQQAWMNNQIRVMVATNAFGMGIDKSDVRLVVHLNLPYSLEAYYQEAGRAGRDLKRSFAVALVNPNDKTNLVRNFENSYASPAQIKHTYHCLGNYFRLAIGSGEMSENDFDLSEFCEKYELNILNTYNCLKELERSGYIKLIEDAFMSSRLMINISYQDLYEFQLDNPTFEPLIKSILRTYEGCFDNYVRINEAKLAKSLNTTTGYISKWLNKLKQYQLLDYVPPKTKPQIVYLTERVDQNYLQFDIGAMNKRRDIQKEKIDRMIEYAFGKQRCRGRFILNYFDEDINLDCGHCDFCLRAVDPDMTEDEFLSIYRKIIALLNQQPMNAEQLVKKLEYLNKQKVRSAIRWLIDKKRLVESDNGIISKSE